MSSVSLVPCELEFQPNVLQNNSEDGEGSLQTQVKDLKEELARVKVCEPASSLLH